MAKKTKQLKIAMQKLRWTLSGGAKFSRTASLAKLRAVFHSL
jgi:hypothetical protein